jgi:hypothetical protein
MAKGPARLQQRMLECLKVLFGGPEVARHEAGERSDREQSGCSRSVVRLTRSSSATSIAYVSDTGLVKSIEPAELLDIRPSCRLVGELEHALQQGRRALARSIDDRCAIYYRQSPVTMQPGKLNAAARFIYAMSTVTRWGIMQAAAV